MPTYVVPAVYDTTKKVIRPAGGCEKISPEYIRLGPRAFLSTDTDNSLREGTDGKLLVHLVSRQRDNLIKLGTDFGVYLDSSNILSGGNDNLLTISDTDGRAILTKPMLEQCGFIDATKVNILFRRHIEQITSMKEAAEESAAQAADSATCAANSATQSANSAQASATSASQSATSASQSANSASQAAASETNSANSAAASKESAIASADSATQSYSSALAAAQQASNAASSATKAATSVTNAQTYAAQAQSYVSTIKREIDSAVSSTITQVKNYRDEVSEDRTYVENAVKDTKTVIQDAASTISANAICPDVIDKAASLAVSRMAQIDSVKADLEDLRYETTEAFVRIAATDVEQSVWLLELKQHQLNNYERFLDLSKVSIVNSEAISEMQLEHCESTLNMAIASVSQDILITKLYKRLGA